MSEAGETAGGRRPYRSPLSEDDVRTMREEHGSHVATYAQLAARYGLSRDGVRFIVTRRRWKHVA